MFVSVRVPNNTYSRWGETPTESDASWLPGRLRWHSVVMSYLLNHHPEACTLQYLFENFSKQQRCGRKPEGQNSKNKIFGTSRYKTTENLNMFDDL